MKAEISQERRDCKESWKKLLGEVALTISNGKDEKVDNQRIKKLQILPYTAWFTYNIATMNYRKAALTRLWKRHNWWSFKDDILLHININVTIQCDLKRLLCHSQFGPCKTVCNFIQTRRNSSFRLLKYRDYFGRLETLNMTNSRYNNPKKYTALQKQNNIRH